MKFKMILVFLLCLSVEAKAKTWNCKITSESEGKPPEIEFLTLTSDLEIPIYFDPYAPNSLGKVSIFIEQKGNKYTLLIKGDLIRRIHHEIRGGNFFSYPLMRRKPVVGPEYQITCGSKNLRQDFTDELGWTEKNGKKKIGCITRRVLVYPPKPIIENYVDEVDLKQ